MKSTTQNTKIAAITEKTLIIGIDVGSETHFARAFNWRGYEFSRKPLDMTIEELKTIIWRYFIVYWNNRRICTANGGLPPMVMRQRYYDALEQAA